MDKNNLSKEVMGSEKRFKGERIVLIGDKLSIEVDFKLSAHYGLVPFNRCSLISKTDVVRP